ncbi:hypothetical protein N7504_010969 [Penicillium tannophilum]|nr:hypothetical protein N7504_010969 [Penicillium tannophilum]
MWLAASWPHKVSLFSGIQLAPDQKHSQMDKFWAAVNSADGKRIENAMRFAEALDDFDLRLDVMEPGLLTDAVQDIMADMKSNWADIEL